MAKLTAFRFRDWMALKDVGGTIPDNALVVAGENRSGKTPLLRAIDALIYGPKAAPDMPIRQGEMQAVLEGDIEDPPMHIKRKVWTAVNKQTGEVTGLKWSLDLTEKRGGHDATVSAPQSVLEQLFGARCADVREFALLGAGDATDQRKQMTILQTLMGVDLTDIEGRRALVRENRTLANRDAKKFEAQLAGMPVPDAGTPDEEISLSDVTSEIEKLQGENAKAIRAVDLAKAELSSAGRHKAEAADDLADCQNQIKELHDQLTSATTAAGELREDLGQAESAVGNAELMLRTAEKVPLHDLAPFRERLTNAEAINEAVRAKAKREAAEVELADSRADAIAQEKALAALAAEQAARMEAGQSKLGVPGLGIDAEAGIVTYEGIPSSQWGSSQGLLISARIQHGANPDGILLVREASLCGDEALSQLVAFAEEVDATMILEVHGEPESASLIIEATENGSIVKEKPRVK